MSLKLLQFILFWRHLTNKKQEKKNNWKMFFNIFARKIKISLTQFDIFKDISKIFQDIY